MKIRYFMGFAILYIAIVTGYGFYVTTDKYELHNTLWFDFSLTLPIALWLALPMVVLLICAWLFMSINMVIYRFKNMSLRRDIDKVIAQVYEQALGNDVRDRIFANNDLRELSRILKRFYFLPNLQSSTANNEKIDSLLYAFIDIENGIESSKLKINPKHPLFNSNAKNAIQHDPQKALEILKQNFDIESLGYKLYKNACGNAVYSAAWTVILESKNSKIVDKALRLANTHITFEIALQLALMCAKEEITISQDMLIQILRNAHLNEREYLTFAIQICKNFNQNTINFWLSIFEVLSKEIENSVFGYFYILLEVGKTNEAMDLKKQYPKDDYLSVSAFNMLKEKGFPLLVFFDPLLYRSNKRDKMQLMLPNVSVS